MLQVAPSFVHTTNNSHPNHIKVTPNHKHTIPSPPAALLPRSSHVLTRGNYQHSFPEDLSSCPRPLAIHKPLSVLLSRTAPLSSTKISSTPSHPRTPHRARPRLTSPSQSPISTVNPSYDSWLVHFNTHPPAYLNSASVPVLPTHHCHQPSLLVLPSPYPSALVIMIA